MAESAAARCTHQAENGMGVSSQKKFQKKCMLSKNNTKFVGSGDGVWTNQKQRNESM